MVTRRTSQVRRGVLRGAPGPYAQNSAPGHVSVSALRSNELAGRNVTIVRDDLSTATVAALSSSLTMTSS